MSPRPSCDGLITGLEADGRYVVVLDNPGLPSPNGLFVEFVLRMDTFTWMNPEIGQRVRVVLGVDQVPRGVERLNPTRKGLLAAADAVEASRPRAVPSSEEDTLRSLFRVQAPGARSVEALDLDDGALKALATLVTQDRAALLDALAKQYLFETGLQPSEVQLVQKTEGDGTVKFWYEKRWVS